MHGNLIEALPEDIGKLTKLWRLSLAGNRILRLPESLGNARELRELSLSGNLLSEVPAFIGNFGALRDRTPGMNECDQGSRNCLFSLSKMAYPANSPGNWEPSCQHSFISFKPAPGTLAGLTAAAANRLVCKFWHILWLCNIWRISSV